MKITTVKFGKTYSLGNYCSERIDLEASIDETTESVTDAVFQLREYCDQLHKKNNPHLYQEQETTQGIGHYTQPHDNSPEDNRIIVTKKTPPDEVLAQLIEDATTLKALKWLEKPSEKFPQTKELYQNKLKSLQTELGKDLSSPPQKAEI